ncbi:MAG: hypothetical protein EBU88_19530, partial [Acidobacteria bacterium]|nr:hypothetical protein [Acidobacteriota bacterium]
HLEQAEHILGRISNGQFRDDVVREWDELKLTRALQSLNPPSLDDFWKIVELQHALHEYKAARESSNSGAGATERSNQKRKYAEVNSVLSSDSKPCKFFAKGSCKATNCRFSHDTPPTTSARTTANSDTGKKSQPPGKGGRKGGRANGKGSNEKSGSPRGKGQSDKSKTSGSDKPEPQHCKRCKTAHRGGINGLCVFPPCRYCSFEGLDDVDHHLRSCPRKPADWVFDSSAHSSKSDPDKLRVSVTRGKESNKKVTWGDKKHPFDAKKMVTDLSAKQFQQVSKWVHKVNTISGSSAQTKAESDTEGAASEAESDASTPKAKKPRPKHPRQTPPKKKTEEISTLTKSTVKVKKLNNGVHLQKRLEDAMAKVRGCGRKGNIIG